MRQLLIIAFVLVIAPAALPKALANTPIIFILVDGEEYRIAYKISGGTILDAKADSDGKSITVVVNATEDGKLLLDLERQIIQAQREPTGQDLPFIVKVDGTEVLYSDVDSDSQSRGVEIPFKKGNSEIEIIGTWMVPEFPTTTLILLAPLVIVTLISRGFKR